MNTATLIPAAALALADQIAATLRDARCCDALDPCDDCKGKRAEFQTLVG